jgi:hypothetical protein
MAINKKNPQTELDSTYILKVLMYLIVGSLWLKVTLKSGSEMPLPVGALIGLLFAAHDHFQIDRKIEYAVIIVAMFIGFWIPTGFQLTFH